MSISGSLLAKRRNSLNFLYIQAKRIEQWSLKGTPRYNSLACLILLSTYQQFSYWIVKSSTSQVPALGEGVMKPWMIHTTRESCYPRLQDTKSWTEKQNSPIWYAWHIGTKHYCRAQYYYQETSLNWPIKQTTQPSDKFTINITCGNSVPWFFI